MQELFREMYSKMQAVAGELSNTLFNALRDDLLEKSQQGDQEATKVYYKLEELQRKFFPYEGDAFDYLEQWFHLHERAFVSQGPWVVEHAILHDYTWEVTVRDNSTGVESLVYVVYEVEFDPNNNVHANHDTEYRGRGIAYWGVPMDASSGYKLDEVTTIV